MKQADRLAGLRAQMAKQNLQGFLVPREDEFMGEYVPERGERLKWITGFTGSAGNAAILKDSAMVMSDGRYDTQLKDQIDPKLFTPQITDFAGYVKWIAVNAKAGDVIGYDPKLHSAGAIEVLTKALAEKKITLAAVDQNPLDAVWTDQPDMPFHSVAAFPDSLAGQSAEAKRETLAAKLRDDGISAAILTKGESIAWLLNIRGNDVPHTPFALSYAVLHSNGDVDWFIDVKKISPELRAHLGNRVQIHAPDTIEDALDALAKKAIADDHRPVLVDPKRSPVWFKQKLEAAGAKIHSGEDPCMRPRAIKNPQEQAAIRDAHIRDGVAVTRFLHWLDKNHQSVTLTELDIDEKLLEFRRMDKGFLDTSFDTIAGWGPNGAIVHYRATQEKHATITPPGILLLDSGGQYREGTTDITRTIPLGEPTAQQKDDFTRVLIGHIAVSSHVFPKGTTGKDIDPLAHKALWDVGLDFTHGTGHGVGHNLSVHEDGIGISNKSEDPIVQGGLVSIEPGLYRVGSHGIRIESLALVVEAPEINGKPALKFDTVTLAPIDRRLIDFDLLSRNQDHVDWLNDYHARVYKVLSPYLDAAEREWLNDMTAPLGLGGPPLRKKPDAAIVHSDVWPYPK